MCVLIRAPQDEYYVSRYTRDRYTTENVNRPFDGMNLKHIPTHWLLSKREYSVKGGNW
jgi:hypothetical protein